LARCDETGCLFDYDEQQQQQHQQNHYHYVKCAPATMNFSYDDDFWYNDQDHSARRPSHLVYTYTPQDHSATDMQQDSTNNKEITSFMTHSYPHVLR